VIVTIMAHTTYHAPLELMDFALHQAAEVTGATSIDGYASVLAELAGPILENAARFASNVLSPLNSVGDRFPSRCEPQGVIAPPGFAAAYSRFWQDGWVSLGAPAAAGGQGLPTLLAAATTEMWGGANLAFAMCPELAVGAIAALRGLGAAELLSEYVPRLVSGEWTASMCLTEPQAGSDLSTLRTRAEPDGAAWRLFGRKIYISWGDHDLAENIVHFVLARTADAPPGLRGISLFLVPKRLPSAAGALEDNDIHAVSIEHKMGIRASPTCVMALGERDGARGWLVGRLHDGLGCMFTIMNHMRLGVGLHSLGLAERSLQLARDHAHERLQGRDASGLQRPIIEHADVRRMLLTMKSLTHAARCLAYTTAATLDVAESAPDPGARAAAASRADLLTPVVKAWCSDVGVEVASLGVQIHGGMGYIDAAEISQVYRDARIGPIFEGTNYIQAQDLLGRKVIRDRGRALGELLVDMERAAAALPAGERQPLARLRSGLMDGCTRLRTAAAKLIEAAPAEPDLIGVTAHHFLQWLGVLAGAWQLALSATRAGAAQGDSMPTEASAAVARTVIDCSVFYSAHILPRIHTHEAAISCGAGPVTAAHAADL
jgi:alkylation response protein AidB-like acyl-CoA dehydrogenase